MKAEQQAILLQYLDSFLTGPEVANAGTVEEYDSFDQQRVAALPELKKLLGDFISGKIDITEFKEAHDIKSREFPYWGFGGFSGQMQLNQFANNIEGADKETVFRNAVQIPATEDEAREKIDTLAKYIADKRSTSDKRRSLPRPASVKYVLTYFWEIQDHMKWPVYYNSSRQVLASIGFLNAETSEGGSYLDFLKVMREILALYKANVKSSEIIKYPFWFVEHVLWKPFINSNTTTGIPTGVEKNKNKTTTELKSSKKIVMSEVANEWLPPIIADLNDLAFDRETDWSKRNALKPEKAFETKVCIAFTLLGYEATELGQGTGRQPDGLAISINVSDGDYAIVYDAKAREKYFSVGTSDREMFEYIKRKGEELKKLRVNRSSFLILSSEFDPSPTNLDRIKVVFRRTRIPIVMMKAVDLLFLIEEKLKDTDLTHESLEPLFLETGILTREKIVDILGIR